LLLFAPLALAWWARRRLEHRYQAYTEPDRHLASGLETAEVLLGRPGLGHVGVERARGRLSDHVDPLSKVLGLSPEVAAGRSIASIGIVAHEVGHAHHDATGYPLLALQQRITLSAAPFIRWGGWFPIGGLVFEATALVGLAGIGFGATALAGLLSVPVECEAAGGRSRR
jgi:Zn-dependent membrane protease YugP